jgi:hypothetical protein
MPQPLLNLQPTADPMRFRLEVTPQLCVGPREHVFMFGGVGLASAVEAAKRVAGRYELIWATAQYLSYARPGSVLEVDVRLPVQGHNITQAVINLHCGDEVIISARGAIARGKAGGWGAVGDMLSEKSAAAAALKQCKATASTKVADCKVTITYYNQCVVYVWGSAGGVSSSAIDIPTANERAMARCRETSSDCELLYSNCSYGRQIN